jgi:phenylacetic acid degradation protein
VGPLASLRGDFGRIVLEEGANLQDTCVMHGFPDSDTVIERDGHIGHGAVLHGCRIGADALVGMNAVVMDNARIGPRSFVSAAAFVKAGFECPEQSLVMGAPASIKRGLSDEEVSWKQAGTREYQQLAKRCLEQMQVCEPLTEPEPDRPRISDSGFRPKGSTQ